MRLNTCRIENIFNAHCCHRCCCCCCRCRYCIATRGQLTASLFRRHSLSLSSPNSCSKLHAEDGFTFECYSIQLSVKIPGGEFRTLQHGQRVIKATNRIEVLSRSGVAASNVVVVAAALQEGDSARSLRNSHKKKVDTEEECPVKVSLCFFHFSFSTPFFKVNLFTQLRWFVPLIARSFIR